MIAYLDAIGQPEQSEYCDDSLELTVAQCFFGIGVPDGGVVLPANGLSATSGQWVANPNGDPHFVVAQGNAISVDAPEAGEGATFTYTIENVEVAGSATPTGATLTDLAAGSYRVVTAATTADGKLVKKISYIDVTAPLAGNQYITLAANGQDVVLTLDDLSNLVGGATGYDYIKVYWGNEEAMTPHLRSAVEADGNKVSYSYGPAAAGDTFRVDVLFFKDGARFDTYYDTVTLD
jgi:hypothetical protein